MAIQFARRLFAAIAAVCALIVFQGSDRPAHAGYWTAVCQGNSTIVNEDGAGAGIGLAASTIECSFPTANSSSCSISSAGNQASCHSWGNNISCTGPSWINRLCSSLASHDCDPGEIATTGGGCVTIATCDQGCGGGQKTRHPIEISTGRKFKTVVDWSSGGADPLTFTRQYSSFYSNVGAPVYSRLGKAWRSNFDARAGYILAAGATPATAVNGNRLHFVLPDGNEYSFIRNSGLWRHVLPRAHATIAGIVYWDQFRTDLDVALTITSDSVELRIGDGTRYVFDNAGLLVSIKSPSGYTQWLEYAATLNTRVIDSFGRAISFEYETDPAKQGLLKSLTTPDGKKISFTYVDRLVIPAQLTVLPESFSHAEYGLGSVIYPDATPLTDTDNPRQVYEYLQSSKFPYALTGIIDERGIRHGSYAYDAKGRAISSQHEGGADLTTLAFDDINNKVTVTNALGRSTVYAYQRVQGSLQRLLTVDGIATSNCAASNTAYTYDANGFRNQATDAEGRVTKWVKNTRGLPTSTTEGFGTAEARTTATSWDATRPLPTQIVKPGLTADITYNSAGNVTSLIQTDTTATTQPYSTNGQTRATAFGYTSFTAPQPPPIGPTGTPLSDIVLTIVNPNAETGDTAGWTSTIAISPLGVRTTGACAASKCFWGSGSSSTSAGYLTLAHQDIAVPSANHGEVDSGQRAAKLAWRQKNDSMLDALTLRLVFLDQAGAVIGSAIPESVLKPSWSLREKTIHVPSLTRTIRVQMVLPRAYQNISYGFVDDIALTLIADGAASAKPFLTVANPDALSLTTSGWTISSGSITASSAVPCDNYACFKNGTVATDRFYQDIAIPTDRHGEVDTLARGVEVEWIDRTKSAANQVAADLTFLDASGQAIAGAASTSPSLSSLDAWTGRLHYADIPAGARQIRLGLTMSHGPNSNAGAFFTGISARLVGRKGPQGSIDLLTSVDGPLSGTNDTVAYQYDTKGNLSHVTNELGHITQIMSVNLAGQPLTIRDANGIDTTMAYDPRGRLVTVTVNPGAGQAVTSMEYDAIGQITKVTAPDGSFLSYTWSDARRLTTVANTTGETIAYGYNANGDQTSAVVKSSTGTVMKQQSALFDELGRLMRSIGAASQQTTYGYDRTDKLVTVTDPRSNLYAYAYDALMRLIRETDQGGSQVNLTRDPQDEVVGYSDPRSIVTSYVRNGFGEVIQEASPDAGATIYVRDARSLVTQTTDGRGVVSNYTYDNGGRLTSVSYPSAPAENVTYTYDSIASGNKGIGRLTSLTDQSGSTSRVYDALGRIVSETRLIGTKVYTTTYTYDPAGNLMGMTYPSGRIVTFTRNALGQVTSVVTQANALAAYETVASGIAWKPMSNLLASMTHGNGVTNTAAYDLDYRLTSLLVQDGATPISSLSYAYGDGMNLTAVNDNVQGANSVSLGYSPANRLSSANGPWGNATYSYDGVGNRLSEIITQGGNTITRLASYPPTSNRISGVTENGASLRAYTYDGAGNILTDARPGETLAFTYNARNRPVTVTRNSVAWADYGYNALEQLVTRSTSAPGGPVGTVHYIHNLSGHIIAEADGATLREYIWLPGPVPGLDPGINPVDLPVGVVTDVNTTPTLLMVHTDHLARPIRMTNAARAIVWQASFTPWGEPQSISGIVAQNLRFPGQYFQIETGLAYNWHRNYDPLTGRYTQPDPLRFVDGPSIYAYAGNSPFIYVDPTGEGAFAIGGGIVGAIAGGIGGSAAGPGGAIAGAVAGGARGYRAGSAIDAALAAASAMSDDPAEEAKSKAQAEADADRCTPGDDEECDVQLVEELAFCATRFEESALPGAARACRQRAQDRWIICKRNARTGGNDTMPPPWSEADEEVWYNYDLR